MRPDRFSLALLVVPAAVLGATAACDDTSASRKAEAAPDAAPGSVPPALDGAPAQLDEGPPDAASEPADADPNDATGGRLDAAIADASPDAAAAGPLACEDIPAVGPVDVACATGDECGPGGVCAGPGGELRCLQLCIPARCEAMCPEGSTCRSVLGADGMPRELFEGSPLGVCYTPPPPAPTAYELCGEDARCGAELVCVPAGATPGPGLCLPACAGEAEVCPGAGICTVGVDPAQPEAWFCLAGCDAPDACGEGLACLEMPAGLRCLPAGP
jgi:hypothetical protein